MICTSIRLMNRCVVQTALAFKSSLKGGVNSRLSLRMFSMGLNPLNEQEYP